MGRAPAVLAILREKSRRRRRIIRSMHRFALLLLALLMPLQTAWAMAASYCQHESSRLAAAHFGHHSHQHDGNAVLAAEAGTRADGQAPANSEVLVAAGERIDGTAAVQRKSSPETVASAQGKSFPDLDCGVCHGAHTPATLPGSPAPAVLTGASPIFPQLLAAPSSAPSRAPDRPRWTRPA